MDCGIGVGVNFGFTARQKRGGGGALRHPTCLISMSSRLVC